VNWTLASHSRSVDLLPHRLRSDRAAAVPPQPAPSALPEQLDEFGQAQSAAKPSLADDLDDELLF